MKNILVLPVGAVVLLAGCMHNYDITLVNGMKITRVSKPKLDKETDVYTFKDIKGRKKPSTLRRVVEIAPHSNRRSTPGRHSNKSFDVFADQVRFQVDGIAHFAFLQRCHLARVRNDPNFKAFPPHRRHRQADAVHRDRSLENDIAHNVRGALISRT